LGTDPHDTRSGDVDLARRMIGLIDLTDLADDRSGAGIDDLCRRARDHHTAAVCVWPEHVARCVSLLAGTGVRVATVVNFPSGDEPVASVVAATRAAIDDGADDIDVVLPYRSYLEGDVERAGEMVAAIAGLVEAPRVLKVILESGVLGGADAVGDAARLAIARGADFVKTSTGKVPAGASLQATGAMLGAIAEASASGRTIGLKPSGGIRSLEEAAGYVRQADSVMGEGWATPATFRFGASGLLDALLAVVAGEPGAARDSSPDPTAY
jgi:deoxyribose-phosphate aldolase